MSRPRVVIVGAGLAGLAAAAGLRRAPVNATVIDRCNRRLSEPSCYRLRTAGLVSAGMPAPLRSIVRNNPSARVLLDEVWGIDPAAKLVRLHSSESIGYDHLVLATGARKRPIGDHYWGDENGPTPIEEATAVRRKVLFAVERAAAETDETRKRALGTFVVIGGGPAGAEMAHYVAVLADGSLLRTARVVLIERDVTVLPEFPQCLSQGAKAALGRLGVEVMLGQPVMKIAADHVMVGDERIDTFTPIWASGVQATPAGAWLGVRIDAMGRLAVTPDLRVPGYDGIYAVGDTARFVDDERRLLPPIAQVAEQQGQHVAVSICSGIDRPFRYRDHGGLAAIARRDGLRAGRTTAISQRNSHQENDYDRHAVAR